MKDKFWKGEVAEAIGKDKNVVKYGTEQMGMTADHDNDPGRGGRRIYSYDNIIEFGMVEEYRALGFNQPTVIKLYQEVRAARLKRPEWWTQGIQGIHVKHYAQAHIYSGLTAETSTVFLEEPGTEWPQNLPKSETIVLRCTVHISEILERVAKKCLKNVEQMEKAKKSKK